MAKCRFSARIGGRWAIGLAVLLLGLAAYADPSKLPAVDADGDEVRAAGSHLGEVFCYKSRLDYGEGDTVPPLQNVEVGSRATDTASSTSAAVTATRGR